MFSSPLDAKTGLYVFNLTGPIIWNHLSRFCELSLEGGVAQNVGYSYIWVSAALGKCVTSLESYRWWKKDFSTNILDQYIKQ